MAICIEELGPDQVGAWANRRDDRSRSGRIKYWNQQRVFVVYNCAGRWDRFADFVAVATDPDDLDFVQEAF